MRKVWRTVKIERERKKNRISALILPPLLILCLVLGGLFIKGSPAAGHVNESASELAQTIQKSPEKKVKFTDTQLNQSIRLKAERDLEKQQQAEAFKQLQANNRDRIVYLTFDDGPSPYTDELLDVLNTYQMQATFFMLGPNIKNYPGPVRRMVNEGFAVGMHGITHDANKVYESSKAPLQEMLEDQQIIADLTGVESNLVRLPYGSVPYLTMEMRYYLDQQDFNIWDWNVDSEDWALKDKRYVNKVIQGIKNVAARGEAPIILLHDKPETIHALPELLSYLKKNGYQTKVLTDDQAPYTFQCNGRCYSFNEHKRESGKQ